MKMCCKSDLSSRPLIIFILIDNFYYTYIDESSVVFVLQLE